MVVCVERAEIVILSIDLGFEIFGWVQKGIAGPKIYFFVCGVERAVGFESLPDIVSKSKGRRHRSGKTKKILAAIIYSAVGTGAE